MLEGFGNGEGGRGCEFRGGFGGVGPAEDSGKGREAVFFERGFGDEDDGRGAIGERGGVGSGDGAGVGDEGRLDGLKLLDVERHLRLVVFGNDGRGFTPGAGDRDGVDFGLEPAILLGGLGFRDGADGVVVLLVAGEAVVGGAFFALETHMLTFAVGVSEAIAEDAIDELDVAEFGPCAEDGEVVGGVGHGLGTASNDDGGVAGHDCLGTEDNGFEAGGADLVDGCADCGVREGGAYGTLAGRVLAETRTRLIS